MFLFDEVWADSKLMNLLVGCLIIGSLILSHLTSTQIEREPLPSSLFYCYNADSGQAKWGSSDKHINIGNEAFLKEASFAAINMPRRFTAWNVDTPTRPHVNIPQIAIDSLNTNIAYIISTEEVYKTAVLIDRPNNVRALYLNDIEIIANRSSENFLLVDALAMKGDTLTLRIEKKIDTDKQKIRISSHFRSLPTTDILPKNALRTDGYSSIVQEFEM